MAPVKAMKAVNVTKAMKKAAVSSVSAGELVKGRGGHRHGSKFARRHASGPYSAPGPRDDRAEVTPGMAAKKVKTIKKTAKTIKKSKKADAVKGGFEVLLTVCRECKEAVEIVRCLAELEVMTLTEYYCRQGCTTCLELHAVLIK